ncbi:MULTISPECIES: hypothetical protein [Metabacillus]|uniref:Helix-turn-helix domain-containing protein n=2 Tax=Metabacillus TaxID=2675233 RepID=A0A179T405_9BACI|nr:MULTISPECIES: hypothetical protein [Metabacillus]OAS87839.1 hypothetical protein A6K24_19095 [Metabacillus litoralis]QNF27342.1 hypothetical protein HUW50_07325 [Metabacillus sp. KUDC1714]
MLKTLTQTQVQVLEEEVKVIESDKVSRYIYFLREQQKLIDQMTNTEIDTIENLVTKINFVEENRNVIPDYLSTMDVSWLLSISPQMVRKYCQEGVINAWRTMGDRGEWRVEVNQYKNHPKFDELLVRLREHKQKNRQTLEAIKKLSNLDEYHTMFDEIEKNKKHFED